MRRERACEYRRGIRFTTRQIRASCVLDNMGEDMETRHPILERCRRDEQRLLKRRREAAKPAVKKRRTTAAKKVEKK